MHMFRYFDFLSHSICPSNRKCQLICSKNQLVGFNKNETVVTNKNWSVTKNDYLPGLLKLGKGLVLVIFVCLFYGYVFLELDFLLFSSPEKVFVICRTTSIFVFSKWNQKNHQKSPTTPSPLIGWSVVYMGGIRHMYVIVHMYRGGGRISLTSKIYSCRAFI